MTEAEEPAVKVADHTSRSGVRGGGVGGGDVGGEKAPRFRKDLTSAPMVIATVVAKSD